MSGRLWSVGELVEAAERHEAERLAVLRRLRLDPREEASAAFNAGSPPREKIVKDSGFPYGHVARGCKVSVVLADREIRQLPKCQKSKMMGEECRR